MDFFIKKIFERKTDESVHIQFQKFSRGEFKDRAMVKIKNSNGRFSISTTPEYANEFVRYFAEKLGDDKTLITGVIVSTQDLSKIINFKDKKQFAGVKQYIIDNEMSGKEIIEICNKLPKSFIGLSFKANEDELKIKTKAPKLGKPSTKIKEEPKIDFCKVKTTDNEFLKNLLFEKEAEDFKKIEIRHDFIVTDIIIPDVLKKEKNFEMLREKALRKGKIIRHLDVDGKKLSEEIEFEA